MHTKLMHTKLKLGAAATAVAVLAATVGTAAASSGASAAAPNATSAASAGTGANGNGNASGQNDKYDWLAPLAQKYHVNVAQLQSALLAAKQLLGQGAQPTGSAVVGLVAARLGLSTATAQQLVDEVFGSAAHAPTPGTQKPAPPAPTDAQIAHVLAGILGVSDARAAQVLAELKALPSPRQAPNDPRLAALAASLHLTVDQLSAKLALLKQDLSGLTGTSGQSGKS